MFMFEAAIVLYVGQFSQLLGPNLMFCFNTSPEKEKQITLSVVDWTWVGSESDMKARIIETHITLSLV